MFYFTLTHIILVLVQEMEDFSMAVVALKKDAVTASASNSNGANKLYKHTFKQQDPITRLLTLIQDSENPGCFISH